MISKSQEKINEFKERKAKSDAELAQKAMAAIQKQNEKRKKAAQKAAPVDGPVVIGRKIADDIPVRQMIDINEEERSVVVQGYIFDREIRQLRSERKLLILKVTDYSSSFVIKKFSRDENDEALFDALKPGKWIKARGSVQEDTYMRDLTINAYDIMEVHHEERQDTAPEDQKRVELHLHTNMSQMDATNSISDYVAQAAKWGQKQLRLLIMVACKPSLKRTRRGKRTTLRFYTALKRTSLKMALQSHTTNSTLI